MKRNILLFIATMFVTMVSYGQKQSVYVVVTSEESIKKELHIFEDIFHGELLKTPYEVKVANVDSDDEFSRARNTELYNNLAYSDDYNKDQVKGFGQLMEAKLLCVVVVEKFTNGNYYFRSKLFDLETGELKESASYPDQRYSDKPIKDITNRIADVQHASNVLVNRLLNPNFLESYRKKKKETNLKAAGASLPIPGLGLVLKGHNEGYAYLGAEAALCLGGVMVPELMRKSYINKMNHESNAHNKDVYTTRANSCRKVSIICGACAGVLHVVNIVHSFMAEPNRYKNPKLRWDVAAIPVDNGFSNDYAMGLSLSYRF